jgi:SAM-dependent methyltransferase
MSHYSQIEFIKKVKQVFPEFFRDKKVLEVGSWDVNGSVRRFFTNCDYLGVDVAEGPGVDLVCEGQNLEKPSNYFDVVISCECFEHNPFWLETFVNMIRMLKPHGLCIVSCATTGRGEHGTRRKHQESSLSAQDVSPDYYRNLVPKDFTSRMQLERHLSGYFFHQNIYAKDLYFIGIKKSATEDLTGLDRLVSLERETRLITKSKGSSPLGKEIIVSPSIGKKILTFAGWICKCSVVKCLGEKNYHDLKYRYKSLTRRTGSRKIIK